MPYPDASPRHGTRLCSSGSVSSAAIEQINNAGVLDTVGSWSGKLTSQHACMFSNIAPNMEVLTGDHCAVVITEDMSF